MRPRALSIRSYSSGVMLCLDSSSGVTVTGSGTTAEEAGVITIASIVAWDAGLERRVRMWKVRPLQSKATKVMQAGLPTPVYWPVEASAPELGSIRKLVMASDRRLQTKKKRSVGSMRHCTG